MFLLLLRHNFSDFVKPASSKGKSIDDIHLTEDELGLYLDLAPFLNPSPYIVPEDMSLAKVSHALLVDYTSISLRWLCGKC
jgi:chloride channel 7